MRDSGRRAGARDQRQPPGDEWLQNDSQEESGDLSNRTQGHEFSQQTCVLGRGSQDPERNAAYSTP